MSRLRRNDSIATDPQGAAVKHIYKIQQPVGTMRANDARDNHRLLEGQAGAKLAAAKRKRRTE